MGLCPPSESSRSQRPPSSSRSEDRDSSRRLPSMRSLPLQRIPTRSSSMMVRLASPYRLRPQVFATSRRLHPPRVCWPCFMPDPLMGLHPPEPSSARVAARRLRRRYPHDVEGTRIDLRAATAPTTVAINTAVHHTSHHVETIRVTRFAPYAPHRRNDTSRPGCATLRVAEAPLCAQHRSHPPNDRSRPACPSAQAPCDTAEAAPPPAPHPPGPSRRNDQHPASSTRGAPNAEANETRATLPEAPGRRSDRSPTSSHPASPAPKRKLCNVLSLARPQAAETTCNPELTRPENAPSEKTASPNGLHRKPREPPRLQGLTPREKLSPRSRWFRPATGT
jgi:hypothetical protein